MADFPADLIPTGRTFTPGVYPHTAHPVFTGKESRIRHSNTSSNHRLRVSFTMLTTAEMLDVRQHYADQLGGFLPFVISDDLLIGTTTPADFTPTGHRWRYSGSPLVEDVPLDDGAPLNRHNVEIELECIPPESRWAAGLRLRATVTWRPGRVSAPIEYLVTATWLPGMASSSAPGMTLTATATWEPGRAPIPGLAVTATATWAPGIAGIVVTGEYFMNMSVQLYTASRDWLPDWWGD